MVKMLSVGVTEVVHLKSFIFRLSPAALVSSFENVCHPIRLSIFSRDDFSCSWQLAWHNEKCSRYEVIRPKPGLRQRSNPRVVIV